MKIYACRVEKKNCFLRKMLGCIVLAREMHTKISDQQM